MTREDIAKAAEEIAKEYMADPDGKPPGIKRYFNIDGSPNCVLGHVLQKAGIPEELKDPLGSWTLPEYWLGGIAAEHWDIVYDINDSLAPEDRRRALINPLFGLADALRRQQANLEKRGKLKTYDSFGSDP